MRVALANRVRFGSTCLAHFSASATIFFDFADVAACGAFISLTEPHTSLLSDARHSVLSTSRTATVDRVNATGRRVHTNTDEMSAFTITSTPVVRAAAGARASKRSTANATLRATPAGTISTGKSAALRQRKSRAVSLVVRAEAEAETSAPAAETLPPVPGSFSKICDADDLPRGTRKKVTALGKAMLLFWYKDSMVAIEARSPAEGAFSEGFENARLTQDGCIVCPSTQSTFDLKTGEIKDWYPDNPVLRRLTPIETCRPMEVFPCLARPDGVYVDVKNGSLGPDFVAPATKGGSNTSLENNNVYAVEPQMVVVGADGKEIVVDAEGESGMSKMDPGTLAISIAGVAALALGGSAVCVFYEQYVGLGLFWLVGFGIAAKVGLEATGALEEDA